MSQSSEVVHATRSWVSATLAQGLAQIPTASSGAVFTSPDGTRWRQVIANDGVLTCVPTLEPGPPRLPADLTIET